MTYTLPDIIKGSWLAIVAPGGHLHPVVTSQLSIPWFVWTSAQGGWLPVILLLSIENSKSGVEGAIRSSKAAEESDVKVPSRKNDNDTTVHLRVSIALVFIGW